MNTTGLACLYASKIGGVQRGGYVDEQDNFFTEFAWKIDK